MLVDERELTDRVAQIEVLLGEIESFPDPEVREKAADIVQGLLLLYGEGLARILEIVQDCRDGSAHLEAFVGDPLISHLLLIHDLHPVDLEARVRQALEEVRPYLQSHGGNVELLGIAEGVAHLRLQGSCSGCPSSTMTLKLAIEEAIQKAAPDLEGIEAEGVAEPPPRPANFVPMVDLLPKKAAVPAGPSWTVVGRLPQLTDDGIKTMTVSGVPVLFCKIEGTFYAYRNACPLCELPVERAALQGGELTCGRCGHRFDVRRAGCCLDEPSRQLEPVPLLAQDEIVRIALNAPGVSY